MNLDSLEKYFISDKFKIISEDVTYFFDSFKPKTPIQEAKMNDQTGQMLKLSVAGTCLGLALTLSLRRYLPNQFGELSMKRMVFDTMFVMGGYIYFSKMATYQIYQNLTPIRKDLVNECDGGYLKHLMNQKIKYPSIYSSNIELFRDIFNEQELKEWVEKNESIANVFGLQQSLFLPSTASNTLDSSYQNLIINPNLSGSNSSSSSLTEKSNENIVSFDFREAQKKSQK